jgi:uncharacterized protein YqhQ
VQARINIIVSYSYDILAAQNLSKLILYLCLFLRYLTILLFQGLVIRVFQYHLLTSILKILIDGLYMKILYLPKTFELVTNTHFIFYLCCIKADDEK